MDFQGLIEFGESVTLNLRNADSKLWDSFAVAYTNWIIWLPILVLIIIIILRNNGINGSLIALGTLSVTIIACVAISHYLPQNFSPSVKSSVFWGMTVSLMWIIHDRRFSALFIVLTAGFSILSVYDGTDTFTSVLIGMLTGIITASIVYLISKIISAIDGNSDKFYWEEYKTDYSKNGYLVSDIRLLTLFVAILLISVLFFSILRHPETWIY